MGVDLVSTFHDNCEECVIHPKGCKMVQTDIQDLMDQGVLKVCGFVKNEEVSVIETYFNFPKPVEITYQIRDVVPSTSHPYHVVVCIPIYFPFESTKAVPWKYDVMFVDREPKEVEREKSREVVSADVINIMGTSRMTCNV